MYVDRYIKQNKLKVIYLGSIEMKEKSIFELKNKFYYKDLNKINFFQKVNFNFLELKKFEKA